MIEIPRVVQNKARMVGAERWIEALPQYAVGHVDRVKRIRAALPAGLTVAGAGYDGVGIPACIASASRAVEELSDDEGSKAREHD